MWAAGPEVRPLPGALRAELVVALRVLPLLRHEARQPLPRIYCSDASLMGYGVRVCYAPPAEVRVVGRWRERW
eukprot:8675935-Lingulodinium_polyedra.AAC.1